MNLLDVANERLSPSLRVQLGLNITPSEIKAGDSGLVCKNIKPGFQLVDSSTQKVVLFSTEWNNFLQQVRAEYGAKFMRDSQLEKLEVDLETYQREVNEAKETKRYR